MEQDETEESIQALRNLVLLVGSLTTCGFIELKPGAAAVNGSLFKLPGFSVPQPTGRGQSHTAAEVSHTAGAAHASGYGQWSVTLPGRMRHANQMHLICICITVSCIVILTVELGLLVSILLAILLCTDAYDNGQRLGLHHSIKQTLFTTYAEMFRAMLLLCFTIMFFFNII